ncbi:MAG TPA: double-strand break repair helicase AddA [Stellaceae bacterium]|nr:double-strand break repair helicase AddA [Stellaceae bacterium]
MSARSPDELQREAADPCASVWVAASAGAGKTKVLTDRVLTLLLNGSPPTRLLCLTFTRAAAAEMANRLDARLSSWAVLDDAALAEELRKLAGKMPGKDDLDRARRLFATVLDAPGGLRIETIHAFCQSLLRRFPVEAGVPPHFEPMEERAANELMLTAREEVLVRAREGRDEPLADAVAMLARRLGETGFGELLLKIARARGRFQALDAAPGGLAVAPVRLAARLGIAADASEARVLAEACADAAFDGAALRRAADALTRAKAKTDKESGQRLADWLADPAGRAEGFDDYLLVYFTQQGEPRAKLATKPITDASPEVLEALEAERARLDAVRLQRAAAAHLEATTAVLRLAGAILESYARHKESRAALDYEDLIQRSIDLLEQPGVTPWVLFKLDGGLDHLLIDEAQDTNPDQWRVVQALTQEFFTGTGARETTRTVFAVGDVKQSIFSFQGADPQEFLRMRDHFATRAAEARMGWRTVALETSFRSTDAVLETVDAVFADAAAADGVALDGAAIHHEPHRKNYGGRVELWPLVPRPEAEQPEGWLLPLTPRAASEPETRLAAGIAATIKGWLDRHEELPARGRRIEAGDIMVLVRRRTGFVTALVRALKEKRVPVAGVDRMRLTEQLAVEDMIALGNFLLLPEDDLTLATALKGPLFGFDEERLFSLAYGRGKATLWSVLYRRGDEDPQFCHARDTLVELLRRADFTPPYELFTEVLGPMRGRRKILARLGPEAADPLDEFLAAALQYEEEHPPSLQGFLHWLTAAETEVKRDLDQGAGEVRVLTVHGAKGLEAPIVFLPDTTGVPNQREPLQWLEDGLPLWLLPGKVAVPLAINARSEADLRRDREHRRLLYVALTRAADRLYVCGIEPGNSLRSDCWYELVRRGLGRIERAVATPRDFTALLGAEGWAGEGLVFETPQRAKARDDGRATARLELEAALPAWAQVAPPPEPTPPRPLAPSRPAGIEPAVRSPFGEDRGAAYQRGRLVHRLLQSLPDVAPEKRAAAAERFLALPVHGLDAEARALIAAETLAVLDQPEFAPLFAPGSRAEVPVVGLIGTRPLSGQIDRLAVTDEEVLIVDYKTLRPAPASESEVPAIYLDQLAAYVAAVEAIYPGRRVRAALLWTDGPRLMQVSPAALARRLA